MARWFHVRFAVFLVAVVGSLWGCAPQEALVPVTGKVMVDGKAMTTGNLSFRPDKAGGNASLSEPHAEIGADGTYTVITDKRKGAPVGKFFVLITADEGIDPKNPSATPKSLLDRKYADPSNPILKVEVTATPKDGQYDFDLKK
jgi:hypothetical protein